MSAKRPEVFVSMGTPYTDAQRAFRTKLMDVVRSQDMEPRAIDVNEYPTGDPVKFIVKIIEECSGVIVVAYERKHVASGSEKRKSQFETPIANGNYTTPWNHIESAFAYCLDKPLFMICERGLKKEGLIDEKLQWSVIELEINPESLTDERLTKRLEKWGQTLRTHRSRRFGGTIDFNEFQRLPLGEIVSRLTAKSWAIIVGFAGAMVSLGLLLRGL